MRGPRSMPIGRRSAALACGAALSLAGCSSARHAGPPATGADSNGSAGFIAAADGICSEAQSAGSSLKAPRSAPELAPYLSRALELARNELAKLSALQAPSASQRAYHAYLADIGRAVTLLAAADAAARTANVSQVSAILRAESGLTSTSLAAAAEAGLGACGRAG